MKLVNSWETQGKVLLWQIFLLSTRVTGSIMQSNQNTTAQPQIWKTDEQFMGVAKFETALKIQPRVPSPLTKAYATPSPVYHWQRVQERKILNKYGSSIPSWESLDEAISAQVFPRDFSTAQYNFHQIILLLHNISSRIALPWMSLNDTIYVDTKTYNISPLDLALVPEEYPSFSETMVEVKEDRIVIICASQPQEGVPEWKFLKICPEQKYTLLRFLKNVKRQGAKLAIPRETLRKAGEVDLKGLQDGLYTCMSKDETPCAPEPTGTFEWKEFLSRIYSQKRLTTSFEASTTLAEPTSNLSREATLTVSRALSISSTTSTSSPPIPPFKPIRKPTKLPKPSKWFTRLSSDQD